jgi:hypothetical protein
LYTTKLLVALFCKLALHTDHGFEAGVKVRYAQIHELWQFLDELLVQDVKDFLRFVMFLLCLNDESVLELCNGGYALTLGCLVGSSLGLSAILRSLLRAAS